MRKNLTIVAAVVLVGIAGWVESLPVAGLLIDLTCSASQPSRACLARMRSLGHLWSQSGNLDRARDWYQRAAENGDAASMFHLGWVYQQDTIDDANRVFAQGRAALAENASPEALKQIFRRIGAEQQTGGHPDIRALIGLADPATTGIREHALFAAVWYRLAAKQGYAPAMNNLGELYRHGLIGEDDAAALDWFLAAAQAGNPLGAWNVMIAYSAGPGRNMDEVAKWSSWTPGPGVTDQLAEPTFARTTLFGSPLPPAERAMIRERAALGTPVTFALEQIRPDQRIPSFRQRTAVDPTRR